MAQQAELIRLALFGSPVKHSLSPRIHRMFAKQAGLRVEYQAIESSEEYLARDVQHLADSGGRGCNITLPLKPRAFQLANGSSERARRSGVANTLVFESRSHWHADCTDGSGLVRDLTRNLGIELPGKRIAIIGAGGAVAGILYDILAQSPESVTIYNRTVARAEALVGTYAGLGNIRCTGLGAPIAAPSDLVLNATSAGHDRTLPPISREMFAPGGLCYDLNYGRFARLLAEWCAAHDVACHDGLGMLVEQAAESFSIWTGFEPDTGPVLAQLRSAAANRS